MRLCNPPSHLLFELHLIAKKHKKGEEGGGGIQSICDVNYEQSLMVCV